MELLVNVKEEKINQISQKSSHFQQRNFQKAPDSDDLIWLEESVYTSILNDPFGLHLFLKFCRSGF